MEIGEHLVEDQRIEGRGRKKGNARGKPIRRKNETG
jgi:hypothetical protein